MTLRTGVSFLALAAVMIANPAFAAMPVGGVTAHVDESLIIQVAKKKKMTRQQETDASIKSGTVPSRYRSSVPKEYQQYVPFAKQ